jgi:ABC-type multidrug transport system ATPase subunit
MPLERVRTTELVKVYGHTRALAGVSVSLEAGEVTVIEGPNGSGKSTLVSILAQLSEPTAGRIFYGKKEARQIKRAVRGLIGVLAHAPMLYPELSGRENLGLFADLYGVARPKKRIDELIERFEIGPFFERPVRTYSRGQLQRVALARALLHEPELLLLDEPSTGLDVDASERLIEAVLTERERGAVVVVVTHDAAFADRVADRRVRLSRGRVVE